VCALLMYYIYISSTSRMTTLKYCFPVNIRYLLTWFIFCIYVFE